jgi:uncharacterized membrane protein YcaP (DUF421 family)
MPGIGSSPLDVVVRTTVIYLFVVVGLRFGGKRQVGQLSIVDLVVLLLLSNAVQNAMVGDNSSILGGVMAGASILVLGRGLNILIDRFQPVRALIVGEPRILIRDGDVRLRALRQEEVSVDELMEALREHGLEEIKDVKLAILEVDGSISIVPAPQAEPAFQGGGSHGPGGRRAGRIPRHGGVRTRRGGSAAHLAEPDEPHEPGKPATPQNPTKPT